MLPQRGPDGGTAPLHINTAMVGSPGGRQGPGSGGSPMTSARRGYGRVQATDPHEQAEKMRKQRENAEQAQYLEVQMQEKQRRKDVERMEQEAYDRKHDRQEQPQQHQHQQHQEQQRQHPHQQEHQQQQQRHNNNHLQPPADKQQHQYHVYQQQRQEDVPSGVGGGGGGGGGITYHPPSGYVGEDGRGGRTPRLSEAHLRSEYEAATHEQAQVHDLKAIVKEHQHMIQDLSRQVQDANRDLMSNVAGTGNARGVHGGHDGHPTTNRRDERLSPAMTAEEAFHSTNALKHRHAPLPSGQPENIDPYKNIQDPRAHIGRRHETSDRYDTHDHYIPPAPAPRDDPDEYRPIVHRFDDGAGAHSRASRNRHSAVEMSMDSDSKMIRIFRDSNDGSHFQQQRQSGFGSGGEVRDSGRYGEDFMRTWKPQHTSITAAGGRGNDTGRQSSASPQRSSSPVEMRRSAGNRRSRGAVELSLNSDSKFLGGGGSVVDTTTRRAGNSSLVWPDAAEAKTDDPDRSISIPLHYPILDEKALDTIQESTTPVRRSSPLKPRNLAATSPAFNADYYASKEVDDDAFRDSKFAGSSGDGAEEDGGGGLLCIQSPLTAALERFGPGTNDLEDDIDVQFGQLAPPSAASGGRSLGLGLGLGAGSRLSSGSRPGSSSGRAHGNGGLSMTPPRHIGRDLETDGDDADMFRVHVTSPSQKEAMLRIHSQRKSQSRSRSGSGKLHGTSPSPRKPKTPTKVGGEEYVDYEDDFEDYLDD